MSHGCLAPSFDNIHIVLSQGVTMGADLGIQGREKWGSLSGGVFQEALGRTEVVWQVGKEF
jgi:hypothetical protein